jgi:hypothetical protein
MARLLPVVLREIDDLKRAGRTQDLRDAAQRADRRLKGLRTNGDVRAGVRVSDDVYAVFEHIEPKGDRLPSWLDLTVPDDRFVASSLLLKSDLPAPRCTSRPATSTSLVVHSGQPSSSRVRQYASQPDRLQLGRRATAGPWLFNAVAGTLVGQLPGRPGRRNLLDGEVTPRALPRD